MQVEQREIPQGGKFFYGPLGEVIKNVRTVVIPQHDEQTYTTEWQYDTWNRLTSMTYADAYKRSAQEDTRTHSGKVLQVLRKTHDMLMHTNDGSCAQTICDPHAQEVTEVKHVLLHFLRSFTFARS